MGSRVLRLEHYVPTKVNTIFFPFDRVTNEGIYGLRKTVIAIESPFSVRKVLILAHNAAYT